MGAAPTSSTAAVLLASVAPVPRARQLPRVSTRPSDIPAQPPRASSTDDDGALLARIAGGDEGAFGRFYDRHGATVHGLACAIVGEGADAEDVTAAVFAQVWRSGDRYEASRATVAGWLTMITRARALDLLRSRRRRARVLDEASRADDDGLALPLASTGAPDADVEQAELRTLVARSLAGLPAPQRRVIELAYFGGLSQSDIAAELGEPLGTVKTRVRAGLQKLRESLLPVLRGPSR